MPNITLLPSAKVPLIYTEGDTMTTEWYRFFWNIYGFTGTGVIPVDKGGTGLDTIGNHQIIIGNANSVFEPASFSSSSLTITYPTGYVNLELGTSTVTPGTYGSATQVGVFTVNSYGVLTAASNTLIGIDANQITSGTLLVARGGTGAATLTGYVKGNGTSAFTANATVPTTDLSGTITNAQLANSTISGVSLGGNLLDLTAGTGVSFSAGTTYNGSAAITINATGSGGTVTSVTATAPVASTGGTTPVISMPVATTSVSGYLSSTDWTTFNNKQPSGTYVTSVTATTPVTSTGGTTPVIAMPVATTSVSGYLSSTDWTTFNNKGTGSVTSVAASVPAFLSITGSPITTSGTLAITYSGTALPIANGGTAQTSFTTGRIHFGSFSTSASLFWDNTNSYLGVGTGSPAVRVHAYSGTTMNQITADGVGAIKTGINFASGGTVYGQIYFDNNAPYSMSVLQQYSTGALILGTNNTENARIHNSGGVSIGNTTDPGAKNLSVSGTVNTQGYTVAGLPTGVTGARAYVTNALAPTFNSTVTGGGAVTVPVFYNGANWVVG